ncbi:MAG: hypothetical protein LC808_16325, partial [Actinobacteria bacterium]|nr:hypothetical protein [Actinomycetota bacterium]
GWSLDDPDRFDIDESNSEPVELAVLDDESVVLAVTSGVKSNCDWDHRWPELESLYRGWATRRNLSLRSLQPIVLDRDFVWRAIFSCSSVRGVSLGQLRETGYHAAEIAKSLEEGAFSVQTILHLVQGGHCKALIGLPESGELEVKRTIVIDSTNANGLDLSSDVASFCNSRSEALIIIGIGTKNQSGEDVLDSVHPLPDKLTARCVRRIIQRHVRPAIEGLVVKRIAVDDVGTGDILYIHVPQQRPVLTPFIVSGCVIESKVRQNYIAIPFRRGQDTEFESADYIQNVLAVGLAVSQNRSARNAPAIDQGSAVDPAAASGGETAH